MSAQIDAVLRPQSCDDVYNMTKYDFNLRLNAVELANINSVPYQAACFFF